MQYLCSDDGVDEFIFTRPDGSIVKNIVPQIVIDECTEGWFKREHRERELLINAETAYPQWDGEPMDSGMAVDMMFSANGDFAKEFEDVSAETL